MKIDISTQDLSRALFRVQGIAEKKSTNPLLSKVLLNADSEGLVVSATDMDLGLSGRYAAKVHAPGAVCLPAKQLYEVVKSLAGETTSLVKLENDWVEIKSAASKFKLMASDPGEFPALPSVNEGTSFEVPAKDLDALITRTLFCASFDDSRHHLSGVYCETSGARTLRFVATDGHRLALAQKSFDKDLALDRGVIVPRKCFQELHRVLAGLDDDNTSVKLVFSGNSGIMTIGALTLTTRLVEGQFPDYTHVIPREGMRRLPLPRVALTSSLRRVSLLSESRAHGVRMTFANNELELLAEDPEHGEAREKLEISYDGEPLTIGFNAFYILDVLSLLEDDIIIMELADSLSPGVIKPNKGEDFLAVVMPMRI